MIFFLKSSRTTKQPLYQQVYKTIPTKDNEEMAQYFSYQAMELLTNNSNMSSPAGVCNPFSWISPVLTICTLAEPHFLWASTTGTAEQAVKTNLCLPKMSQKLWTCSSWGLTSASTGIICGRLKGTCSQEHGLCQTAGSSDLSSILPAGWTLGKLPPLSLIPPL